MSFNLFVIGQEVIYGDNDVNFPFDLCTNIYYQVASVIQTESLISNMTFQWYCWRHHNIFYKHIIFYMFCSKWTSDNMSHFNSDFEVKFYFWQYLFLSFRECQKSYMVHWWSFSQWLLYYCFKWKQLNIKW
jgi:hypothetical protein